MTCERIDSMPTSENIARELESFYKDYIDAFNREDFDHFSNCFALPYAWVTGERGLSTVADEGAHKNGFGRIMADLKARGWVRSGVDLFKAFALADNLGMIVADYTRYKKDGAILEQGRACYTLRRDAKSWKIVTVSEIKPPYLGPGDIPR
jgi:ketosteroid isomerase-like protein